MVSNEFQKVPVVYLEGMEYKKVHSSWAFIQLTLLVMYDDGFCSLFYTTNLLKDGCLASIGPSYDKNTKMGTFVLIPEHCDILHMCSCKGAVNLISSEKTILTHQQLHWRSLPSRIFPLVKGMVEIWNTS